jgi:hypothetical protein
MNGDTLVVPNLLIGGEVSDSERTPEPLFLKCSFCGLKRHTNEVVCGPGAYICRDYVELCVQVLDKSNLPAGGSPGS